MKMTTTTSGVPGVRRYWTGYQRDAQHPGKAAGSLREAVCRDARSLHIPKDKGDLDRSYKIPGAPYQHFRAIPKPGGFEVELGSNLPYAGYQARRIRGRVGAKHITQAISRHIHTR